MKKPLKHSKFFLSLVNILKLQAVMKYLLRKMPLIHQLPNGTIYRIRSPESYMLADEIFQSNIYKSILEKIRIQTFVDLGCNAGYIECLLCENFGPQIIKGILIDANPAMVEEASWHIQRNRMTHCHAVWGVVGTDDKEYSDFYISDVDLSSSAKKFDKNYPVPIIGRVQRISTPKVDALKIFHSHFQNERIDLLKIDIEGSEREFLEQKENQKLFSLTSWVVIEWHKWHIRLEEMDERIEKIGFKRYDIAKENEICGIAFYRKNQV